MNNNFIVCFDLESSGVLVEENEIVQIAALAIDPHSLEIIPESKFESLMKPTVIFSGSKNEIKSKWDKCWKAWDVNKKTMEELEKAPLPEHVWKAFSDYVKKYNIGGYAGRPIPAGHNIQGFDLLWVDSLCRRYKMADKQGKQQLFNTRTILDTLNLTFLWFENNTELNDYKMDTLREYFGIHEEGHDALVDVKTTAEILIRFMKLHRHYAPKVKFKGAFSR
jgi:DNA polymerase III epsilon subunit-like protein